MTKVRADGNHRIVVVSGEADGDARDVFIEVAIAASNDVRFSFPSFPGRAEAHAFILRHDDELVGLLVAERVEWSYPTDWRTISLPRRSELADRTHRWLFGVVWVASQHRRQGFAHVLIDSALLHFGVAPSEVVWLEPFTQAGEALIRHYCPDALYVYPEC